MGTRRPAMLPTCHLDRLWASLRVRLRVCTVLAGLNLLGTLVVLALVLARH
jgi:hypothetical protein